MNDNQKDRLPLAVADILVDDILNSSDEEILNEAHEQHGDVKGEVSRLRNIISSAVMNSRKSKLARARAELADQKSKTTNLNILSFNVSDKRKLINQAKGNIDSLTLAARNEEDMSESDMNSMLQDLLDLGVIDENGNIKE